MLPEQELLLKQSMYIYDGFISDKYWIINGAGV